MARKEYSQAARLQDLIRTLMARRTGVTLDELHELYHVSRRTLYRDMGELAQAGYPLYAVDGEEGKKLWRLHDRFTHTPPITLSMSEVISLYLTKSQIGYLRGTPFAEDMDALFGRLEKTLSPRVHEQMALLSKKFFFVPDAPKSYAKKLDLLYDVMDALIKQRVCKMGYRSLRKEKASLRQVEPLTLLTHKQGLYLLARERGEERVLTFAVDRIASFDAGSESFDYPADYSPQRQTEGAFGLVSGKDRHKVVLEFSAGVAQLVVERRFHPSQKARRTASGGVVLEMTLGNLSGELLSFVLSYGPDVRVVSPPALQAQVGRAHKAAAAQYK